MHLCDLLHVQALLEVTTVFVLTENIAALHRPQKHHCNQNAVICFQLYRLYSVNSLTFNVITLRHSCVRMCLVMGVYQHAYAVTCLVLTLIA